MRGSTATNTTVDKSVQFAERGEGVCKQEANTKHKVGTEDTSHAHLLPDSLGARELRSEIVDSMAFNGILLEEKVLDLDRQVDRLLLRQKHLGK